MVNAQYPQERRKEQAEIREETLETLARCLEEQAINRSRHKEFASWFLAVLEAVVGIQDISPIGGRAIAGRYTRFSFSPLKKISASL